MSKNDKDSTAGSTIRSGAIAANKGSAKEAFFGLLCGTTFGVTAIKRKMGSGSTTWVLTSPSSYGWTTTELSHPSVELKECLTHRKGIGTILRQWSLLLRSQAPIFRCCRTTAQSALLLKKSIPGTCQYLFIRWARVAYSALSVVQCFICRPLSC